MPKTKRLSDSDIEEIINRRASEMKADMPAPCWFILPRTDWPEKLKENFSKCFNDVIRKFSGDCENFDATSGPMMSEFTLELLFNNAVMENLSGVLKYFLEKNEVSEEGREWIEAFIEFLNGDFYWGCRDGGCIPGPGSDCTADDPVTGELLNNQVEDEGYLIDVLSDMEKEKYMYEKDWLILYLIWPEWRENKLISRLVRKIIKKHGGVE